VDTGWKGQDEGIVFGRKVPWKKDLNKAEEEELSEGKLVEA
jgi:hypothetical protein